MAGCVGGQAPGKLEAGESTVKESRSPGTWCGRTGGEVTSPPLGRFVEISLGLGKKDNTKVVPSQAVTFCKSSEVKFQEPETNAKSKALEEVVEMQVPIEVLAKEEPKTKVNVATALDVGLVKASTCRWEGPKCVPRWPTDGERNREQVDAGPIASELNAVEN